MTRMSKISRVGSKKLGNKSSGVVALMFMSSSLVKELRVPSQKTEFIHKTIQKNAHQHTEAAVRGAILDVNVLLYKFILCVVLLFGHCC